MKQQYVATFKDEAHALLAAEHLRQLMFTGIRQVESQVFFDAYKMPSDSVRRYINALYIKAALGE